MGFSYGVLRICRSTKAKRKGVLTQCMKTDVVEGLKSAKSKDSLVTILWLKATFSNSDLSLFYCIKAKSFLFAMYRHLCLIKS